MEAVFGALLRRYRHAAGLTQVALAERARLSAPAVSALERGTRERPRPATLDRLADALGLTDQQRSGLLAAAARDGGPAPRQLPAAIPDFTGRADLVRQLADLLRSTRTAAITGMGGVGKTALAVQVGHLVGESFPDGVLYVDLRGFGSAEAMRPVDALGQFLRALGLPPDQVPADPAEAATRYRAVLSGRRVLAVLDNAADCEQVAALLPAGDGCAAVVTSRRTLSGLPGAEQIRLGLLTEAEGLQLLRVVAGPERVDADPLAARDVLRRCGLLPLAIRMAGARLTVRQHWPIGHLATQLADERTRIDELTCQDIGVRASLAVSMDHLSGSPDPVDTRAARAFPLLGLLDGPKIALEVAAGLLDLDRDATGQTLERLVELHLLETTSGRYRLHELLQVYARERAAGLDEPAAWSRLLELYLDVAWRCHALTHPHGLRLSWAPQRPNSSEPRFADVGAALAWLDNERAHLLTAARNARGERVVQLAIGLYGFYLTRQHWSDWRAITELALAATGSDRIARARLWEGLASAYAGVGRHREAVRCLRQSLTVFRASGDRIGEATVLNSLSIVLRKSGRLVPAIDHGERSLLLRQELGREHAAAACCLSLGLLYWAAGDHQRGMASQRRSRAIYARLGDERGLAMALVNHGAMLRQIGRVRSAVADLRESVLLFRGCGDTAHEAEALDELATALLLLGESAEAQACLDHAWHLAGRYGDR